jgi:lipopolysaccharide export system protein LptA
VSRRPIPFPFAFRLLPVLVLCFALAAGLQAQRIVLEQAATMRNLPAGELEYKELEGDVVVRYGDSMIRFGFGRYNERDGVLDCVRNVEVHDDGRVLTCDELTLYEKDEKAVARGNVKITGDSMIVHSRLATWWRGLDKVELQTDVEVFDLKDSLKLVCGSAMLDNANGYARASLAPVMTRMGADTLTLKARTLEWWRTEDRALAWKGAELDQKDLKASCDSLVWENGPRVAHLYHTPRILQENREITGDTIRVFLEEEDLDSLSVQGHALVLSPADSVSAKLYDRLEGATLAVSFVEGQASALELAGSARSVTFLRNDDGSPGMNVAEAPRMHFGMVDGELEAVDMGGGVQAWYVPLEAPFVPPAGAGTPLEVPAAEPGPEATGTRTQP